MTDDKKRKRGRPKKDETLSNAERQRRFRANTALNITIKRTDLKTLKLLVANPKEEIAGIIDQDALDRLCSVIFKAGK